MSNPATLYHGSKFKQTELKPGFLHTGVLVKWDKTESNEFLYATTEFNTAAELGFASSLEKIFTMDCFHVDKGHIVIQTPDKITTTQLEQAVVYIYTIECLDKDNWIKNDNEHNGLDTEYKTKCTVRSIKECIKLDVRKWLSNYSVEIKQTEHEVKDGRSKKLTLESRPVYLKW
jgi:hypothetical protein